MKSKLLFLFLFVLISRSNSLSDTFQEVLHEDSQYPLIKVLEDKSVLVISPIIGINKYLETKLDEKGEIIYSYIPHNQSIAGNDVLTSIYNDPNHDSLLLHHGSSPREMISLYKNGNLISSIAMPGSKYYAHKSVVGLKSGKVLLAGIEGKVNDKVLTNVDVNIYDPKTNTFGTGLTFGAYGKLVSCYEQKENEVYCAYVSQQDNFISKLILQYIVVNPTSNTIVSKASQVIKTFYTSFNFLKAVSFNENQAIIVFRVGNGESFPTYGNSGRDVFYYRIEVSNEENNIISGIRYNYLESDCRFRKDAEDESIDVASLLEHRVYIACESDNGKLKGYIIYPGSVEIDEFNFNRFNAKDVRNPVFAKFGKSLGIFYTHINENNNYNVNFHLMNYPECRNYFQNNTIKIPKFYSKELDFKGYVFMNNPYPASRADEQIYAMFEPYDSIMKIIDLSTNKTLEAGKNYDSEKLILKITPGNYEGMYSLIYTSRRNDIFDGLIEGRICKFNFDVPKCLPQCYSCLDYGTPTKHGCIGGCLNDSYYWETYNERSEDYGQYGNCERCNISCYNCWGKFYLEPIPSTNCKKCDYENGYYHFFKDEKTCISEQTQEYWEKVYNRSFYLDKTPEDDKSKWRWRFCHPNCKKCSGPGDDIDNQCDVCNDDLYFFCNQTKGHGIPGTCHADCVNNGFFKKESEGMYKCCPCLDNCKVCPDEHTCDDCFKPFYISAPNKDECVEDCGYCYAKDNTTFGVWKCVNCMTDYPVEKYNLNGTCYDRIPLIEYPDPDVYGQPYLIIDDTCNWLMGCKGGCLTCKTWYTEKCTKCRPGFYKHDYYSLPHPETFPCYTENECKGLEQYKYDPSENGGVPKEINNEGVCYNCRLRESNYCQVNNNFTCGPRPLGTYISIPHYNKLSKCHFRCKTCEIFGNACMHNCLSCKDPSTYHLIPYPGQEGEDEIEGQCQRIEHPCGTYPYYHNYSLAEEVGKQEDNCGFDCDVCLYNRSCTEQFPFYVIASRECVESCAFNEIMEQSCLMDQASARDKFMSDPFDIKEKELDKIEDENIKNIIQISIIKKYAAILGIDASTITQNIYNYIGNGKVFNLPNSQIILGNNISIELTTNELELLKLLNLKKPETVITAITKNNTIKEEDIAQAGANGQISTETKTPSSTSASTSTTVPKTTTTTSTTKPATKSATSSSTEIPKNEKETLFNESRLYITPVVPNLNTSQPSIINMTDCENILKKVYNLPAEENLIIIKGSLFKEYDQYIGNDVNYQVFSSSLLKLLDLDYCRKAGINVLITDFFNAGNLLVSPIFQNKIASAIQDGYDVFDFSSIFYNDICTPFTNEYGYDVLLDDRRTDYFDETLRICKGNCKFYGYNTTTNAFSCACPVGEEGNKEEQEIISLELPKDFYKKHTNSNIKVFKCATQVFSSEGQKKNFGSYILLACLSAQIGAMVYFFLSGTKQQKGIISGTANPPRRDDGGSSVQRSIPRVQGNNDEICSEIALNNAEYTEVKNKDDRSYWKTYWSFLKNKQLLIFTFYTNNDGNIRVVKISLFILFVAFYFAYTALFFNDKIMRNIYIYNGNTNAAIHVPNIIFSSLACLIATFITKFLSLSGRDLLLIKKNPGLKNKIEKKIKIKTILFFCISFILIALCWYYVAAFCAIFKNSQGHYFINVLVAFIVCNIWPCVTTLISSAMRRHALKKDSPCMYKASKIVAYI